MKICNVVGTRPEIIKMVPIIRGCDFNRDFILHTGQHYSYEMDKVFFEELELPDAKYNLDVGSGLHGEQTGKMLQGIEKILLQEKPDFVLAEGDTNTVLAAALASTKLHIKFGHVEAGLRSRFMFMPEEKNRIMADHISDFLFAPTEEAKQNLLDENIPEEKIFVTGNTIVDAVYQNLKLAERKSRIMENLSLEKNNYLLLTAHREENVDFKDRLSGIIEGIKLISEKFKMPVIYPMHPRTKKMIENFGLGDKVNSIKNLKILQPLGFLDFLKLEAGARLIITDSGGMQEESCILKVSCITLRENTERPETLKVGSNILAGASPGKILDSCEIMMNKNRNWNNPFGGGDAGKRIVDILKKELK